MSNEWRMVITAAIALFLFSCFGAICKDSGTTEEEYENRQAEQHDAYWDLDH
jgi:hypothetical protein